MSRPIAHRARSDLGVGNGRSVPGLPLEGSNVMLRLPCLLALLLSFSICGTDSAQAETLRVRILEKSSRTPIPARVHLHDPESRVVKPEPGDSVVFWTNHASTLGSVEFEVSPGRHRLEVERGPEWTVFSQEISVEGEIEVTVELSRIADLKAEGWWSGEMHIHRPPGDVETLMRADDLHFGQVITWWNQTNPWRESAPPRSIRRFDSNRFVHLLGGEDERDGGALLFFGLEKPLDITAGRRHAPSSLKYARQARDAGAWIDLEKPFWWDVPMWVAHGIGDSIGLANNHMYRRGVLGNEAWGRARDLERFPGPRGNALWTQEIYYHLLNCGIRIPPSAGSASGVLPNPVGYNRLYARIEGEPDMEKWFDAVKAGRVFVTNGPLLRVTANGQLPGHVFRSDEKSLLLHLEAQVTSNDPVRHLEVVQDGVVKPFPFPRHLTVDRSGWFLIRAVTGREDGLCFASTGPFYVELADDRVGARQHESARFFVKWCEERMETLRANAAMSDEQRVEVLAPWVQALEFWKKKAAEAPARVRLRGRVRDADSGRDIPSRVYLRSARGRWAFAESDDPDGTAVRYEKRNWINPESEEFHTTLSAHPFTADLQPGSYEVTVERGKEYRPFTTVVEIEDEPIDLDVRLERWVNMASRGWYSGDTHVHRTLADLPNVMLAEDLNVAFPLTYWVTEAFKAPSRGDKSTDGRIPASLVKVDETHVFWPRNTEWEIFSVGPRRHTLGALFALGHREPLERGVPGVREAVAEARTQGALFDLDKHDWPWSMTLPPLVDGLLYELANNHVWRTEFAFRNWNSPTPEYMRPPLKERSGGEREWILYTMANYYALLNCGLELVPTGGTASGVHPVPLGFGRVYVELPGGFDFDRWKEGLRSGRSFMTTGPMLLASLNGQPNGHRFSARDGFVARIDIEVLSEKPLDSVEILRDGQVVETIQPRNSSFQHGSFRSLLKTRLEISTSSWIAVRCWEGRDGGRLRYAHTSPWHIEIEGRPLRPRRVERDYLVQRVKLEIERSRSVLPVSAIEEYEKALEFYSGLEVRD